MSTEAVQKEQGVVARMLPIRTLIADDSRVFLGRLEKWLLARPDFEIVGRAYSGFEAIALSRKLHPDLVVMDVAMPLMNGYEAAARIKEGVRCPVVILISFFERRDAQDRSQMEADAFIKKDSLYEELPRTVERLFFL